MFGTPHECLQVRGQGVETDFDECYFLPMLGAGSQRQETLEYNGQQQGLQLLT